MNKDIKKLSPEELENVTGGAEKTIDFESMQAYVNEMMSQNDPLLPNVEDLHSKTEVGRLTRR